MDGVVEALLRSSGLLHRPHSHQGSARGHGVPSEHSTLHHLPELRKGGENLLLRYIWRQVLHVEVVAGRALALGTLIFAIVITRSGGSPEPWVAHEAAPALAHAFATPPIVAPTACSESVIVSGLHDPIILAMQGSDGTPSRSHGAELHKAVALACCCVSLHRDGINGAIGRANLLQGGLGYALRQVPYVEVAVGHLLAPRDPTAVIVRELHEPTLVPVHGRNGSLRLRDLGEFHHAVSLIRLCPHYAGLDLPMRHEDFPEHGLCGALLQAAHEDIAVRGRRLLPPSSTEAALAETVTAVLAVATLATA
mmetsp:Transcript_83608/g.185689  ORF Transcript_83608/g.185689 Transcript_83608/m.185689 type:complete len:309 (-) Transcript_83608:486-1412(-)